LVYKGFKSNAFQGKEEKLLNYLLHTSISFGVELE